MLFIILEFATILTSVEMDKVLGKSKRQILPQVSYVNFTLFFTIGTHVQNLCIIYYSIMQRIFVLFYSKLV